MIAEQSPSEMEALNKLLNNEKIQSQGQDQGQPQQEQENLTEKVMRKLEVSIQSILDIEKIQFEIINCEHHEKEVPELLRKLIENLETSKTHFDFILQIIKSKTKEEVDEIIKKFRSINVEECYPKIKNGDTSISVVPLNDLIDLVLIDALQEVRRRSENILKEKEKNKEISLRSDDLAQIQILTSKVETINEYFPGLVTLSPENIFSQPKSSPAWTKLYGSTEFAEFMDKKALKASLKMFTEMLTIANAMIYQGQKSKRKPADDSDFNKFAGALSGVYYFANKQKAEINSSLYLTDPKMNLTFGLWSLTEKRLVSELMKTRLPPIGFDKCMYVPRLFPAITRESVLDEYRNQNLETFKPNGDHLKPPSTYNKKEALSGLFNKTLYNSGNNRVKIRIISSKPLTITGKRDEFVKAFISNVRDKVLFDKSKSKYKEKFDGVVIHVHGGGFVAMSSGSHRNYLYRWAKSLNMVVFSIDYKLAPEYPYPAGLDDVWQAYNWLINYSESILGIKMEKIVLAGDSAGGNYVASLALRAIREGVRVPDGLFLCYPALSLNPKDVHPSYFSALDDLVLPSNILKLCLKAYIPEEFKPHMDPFLSPVVASDDLLLKLPPVTIFTGANDPLHDDSWQFAERLQRLNKEVKLIVYKELPHGFLSFDEMAEYELVIAKTVGRIRELFYTSFLPK